MKRQKKIEGPMDGIRLRAVTRDEGPYDIGMGSSESFFLYPTQHTPKELVAELRLMIGFIERNDGAEFYSDATE